MPPRDPSKIQLDFPQLTADLIAQLNLIGTVGLLDFAPTVLPVFIIGDRDLTVDAVPVAYAAAEIFSGAATSPSVNDIIADTGQLPAGTYDVFAQIHSASSALVGPAHAALQHRNAANTATLATLADAAFTTTVLESAVRISGLGYILSANERLRIILLAQNMSGFLSGVIGARLRPIP